VQFEQKFEDYPDACAALRRDCERIVTFYHFPKEHWRQIRTTNVIELPFLGARLRTNAARRFKRVENALVVIWLALMVAESRFHHSVHRTC